MMLNFLSKITAGHKLGLSGEKPRITARFEDHGDLTDVMITVTFRDVPKKDADKAEEALKKHLKDAVVERHNTDPLKEGV